VAAGRLDGFIGQQVSNFELAAGALLIKVAGGLYGDFSGDNNCEENGEIIASQPKLFKNLLTLTPSFTK